MGGVRPGPERSDRCLPRSLGPTGNRPCAERAFCLVTISKWPDATVGGTTGAHMRAVTLRGSWPPSCRIGPGPHGTWRAMPASVPQPTGAPDTACRQRRPASPHRCVGCAPYSRVWRQRHGLKDCHTLCPDTGVGVPPQWAVVVPPQWRRGILKKCVTSQAVYPLSEQHGLKARERRYTAHEEGKHWE